MSPPCLTDVLGGKRVAMPALSDRHKHREQRRRRLGPRSTVSPIEAVAVVIVLAAVVAMAGWFLFFSSGGVGPGTV
jgi:type VI protein secretion system component VasF